MHDIVSSQKAFYASTFKQTTVLILTKMSLLISFTASLKLYAAFRSLAVFSEAVQLLDGLLLDVLLVLEAVSLRDNAAASSSCMLFELSILFEVLRVSGG